jgi:solute carrier family 50 protein (sugar transporter)
MPTIIQIGHDRSVGTLPLLPYSSMIASCFLWLFYGLLRNEAKIWFTNLIGFCFGLFYFSKFVVWAPLKSPTLPGSVQLHVQVCLAIFAATFSLTFLSPLSAAGIIGNIAVLFCLIMFGSPLAALKTVLQTKSASSIPLPFTLATIVNCFLWSVTGLLDMNDVNVYLPNLIGFLFGIVQLALKLIYGDGAKAKGESELEMLM